MIRQNLEFASSVENTFAPANWARIWSMAGSGYFLPQDILVELGQAYTDPDFDVNFSDH